jgi:hypothetical protein
MAKPDEATITQWAPLDGVGRLRLSTGEEVRFGASACPFPPSVGLVVQVLALSPHPLGGQRATAIGARPDVDALFDAAGPLPGLLETAAFVEFTDAVGLLGVVLREPLVTREALRAWLARFGARVDFTDPRCPLIELEGVKYRAWRCMGELAGGRGVMTFAAQGPFSLEKERELALAGVSLGHAPRVEAFAGLQTLARYVAQCSAAEVAVIAHQARGFLATPEAWVGRLQAERLEAWVWQTTSRGGDLVMSGFRALQLPDLFCKAQVSEALLVAGRAMVALGRRPQPGETLGALVVRSSDDAWVGLES